MCCLIDRMTTLRVASLSARPVKATQKLYTNTKFQSTKWEINGYRQFLRSSGIVSQEEMHSIYIIISIICNRKSFWFGKTLITSSNYKVKWACWGTCSKQFSRQLLVIFCSMNSIHSSPQHTLESGEDKKKILTIISFIVM